MILGVIHSVHKWTSKGRKAYRTQWSLLQRSEDGLATLELDDTSSYQVTQPYHQTMEQY